MDEHMKDVHRTKSCSRIIGLACAVDCAADFKGYSQSNFHRCHSTTHGICVPSESGGLTQSLKKLQDSFSKRHGIHLPPLQNRFDSHFLVLLYKMRSSLAPPYLCSLLPQRASAAIGDIPSESQGTQFQQQENHSLSSFVPRSIVLWNALPKEIQESNMLTKFKTQLRTGHLHI